MDFFKSFV